jgi:hypothetical protein
MGFKEITSQQGRWFFYLAYTFPDFISTSCFIFFFGFRW